MDKKTVIGIAALALSCGSLPSFAGPYVGGGAGYMSIDNEDFLDDDNDLRDDHGAFKAYAGGNLNDIFGLEVSHVEFGDTEDGLFQMEAQGQTIAATVGFPFSDDGSLYLKAGQLYWDADSSIAGQVSVNDDGNDNFAGIGMRLGGDEGVGVRLEYEQYDLGSTEVDMPSISLNIAL
jgi:OmpA-OmpF porin, OOP family